MHFFKSLLSLAIAAFSTKLLLMVHNELFKYFLHTQKNKTQATEKSHRDKMNFFFLRFQ